ncbi:hypothetical protein CPC08DRAFT_760640 [Agrocybe pediades]|nr:hypothetical protein CPC08DRAFT_760640 [Agrocybe pediades]
MRSRYIGRLSTGSSSLLTVRPSPASRATNREMVASQKDASRPILGQLACSPTWMLAPNPPIDPPST